MSYRTFIDKHFPPEEYGNSKLHEVCIYILIVGVIILFVCFSQLELTSHSCCGTK